MTEQDAISTTYTVHETFPYALEWFIKDGNFKAEVGYYYKFVFKRSGRIAQGKIIEVEAPKKIVYTWIKDNINIETTVRIELMPQNKGTNMIIYHLGIEKYEDAFPEEIQSTNEGWNYVVNVIEEYLENQKND